MRDVNTASLFNEVITAILHPTTIRNVEDKYGRTIAELAAVIRQQNDMASKQSSLTTEPSKDYLERSGKAEHLRKIDELEYIVQQKSSDILKERVAASKLGREISALKETIAGDKVTITDLSRRNGELRVENHRMNVELNSDLGRRGELQGAMAQIEGPQESLRGQIKGNEELGARIAEPERRLREEALSRQGETVSMTIDGAGSAGVSVRLSGDKGPTIVLVVDGITRTVVRNVAEFTISTTDDF